MVLVTEATLMSLHNFVTSGEGLPPDTRLALEQLKMSELERKHGLMQALPLLASTACFGIQMSTLDLGTVTVYLIDTLSLV